MNLRPFTPFLILTLASCTQKYGTLSYDLEHGTAEDAGNAALKLRNTGHPITATATRKELQDLLGVTEKLSIAESFDDGHILCFADDASTTRTIILWLNRQPSGSFAILRRIVVDRG